jgi:hypothetical protein
MYIRVEGDEHLLIRTVKGHDGAPQELIIANLGSDPELNLFLTAESGRRDKPDLWEGVEDHHLLLALENFKRRLRHQKPALVPIEGNARRVDADNQTSGKDTDA